MSVDRSDLNLVELTGTLRIDLARGQMQASDFTGSLTLNVERGQRALLTRLRGPVLYRRGSDERGAARRPDRG